MINMWTFKWDDPNWDILETITSSHLEEIKISITGLQWGTWVPSEEKWRKVDDLLCRCHKRRAVRVILFAPWLGQDYDHYSPKSSDVLVRYVQVAWPKFLAEGTVEIVPRNI